MTHFWIFIFLLLICTLAFGACGSSKYGCQYNVDTTEQVEQLDSATLDTIAPYDYIVPERMGR